MMPRRRALTLIEVLASLVLLATVAAACIPFFQTARNVASAPATGMDLVSLGVLADVLVASPKRFGLDRNLWLDSRPEVELRTTSIGKSRSVVDAWVSYRVFASDSVDDRVWLVLRSESSRVFRCIPIQQSEVANNAQ